MLVELARRRTDQPQPWALAPAVGLGVAGLRFSLLGPGDRVWGCWGGSGRSCSRSSSSGRCEGRAGHCITGRVECFSIRLRRLGARRSWRRIRDRRGGGDEQQPSVRRSHLPRRWPQPVSALFGFGLSDCDPVQRARGTDAELGVGARRCRTPDAGLCLRSRGPGLEWEGAWSPGRASAGRRRAWPSCGCRCSRPIRARGSLSRRHICTRLRDGLSEGGCRGGADRLSHPVSVRSAGLSGLLLAVASWPGAVSDARARGYPSCFLVRAASSLPSDASRQAREFSSSPRELRADRDEFAELRTVFRQAKALTSLAGSRSSF